MQLILAGVNPEIPEAPKGKKPFENICPNCAANVKASQRPQSSRRLGGMMDFKIKKGNSPAIAAIRNKRKAFEQEQ